MRSDARDVLLQRANLVVAVGGRAGELVGDEDFAEALRSGGFRPSASRVAILREVVSIGIPISAIALSRHLAKNGFDASTISRNVEPFAETGLLIREEARAACQ